MTLETPIVKVINILTSAQEKCRAQHDVQEAIEDALEILRSEDLYLPPMLPSTGSICSDHSGLGGTGDDAEDQEHRSKKESDADEITTDLFTGLIHSNKPISGIRRMSYEAAVAHRQSFSSSLKDFVSPLASVPSSPPPSLTNVPDAIKDSLASQLEWDFDVIHLEQITARRPLVWLGLSVLSHFNVCSTLSCDETTMKNWLTLVESKYRNENPYHNSTHAADVMQATAYFLSKPRLEAIFDPLDEAIALIAAICHDIDHPGKSSAFLCNSGSELALLYNDISVLESHHAALTFKLTLSNPDANIFKNLDKETFKEVRHSMIDMILATEMTKHFEHLTKFVNVFTKRPSIDDVDSASSKSSSSLVESQRGSRDSPRLRSSSLSSPQNVVLIKRMLIKCADVSNPTRPLSLCVTWGNRIADEYCTQTDEEKALGLPVVMPVFDRSSCSIPKSQVRTFLSFFLPTTVFLVIRTMTSLPYSSLPLRSMCLRTFTLSSSSRITFSPLKLECVKVISSHIWC